MRPVVIMAGLAGLVFAAACMRSAVDVPTTVGQQVALTTTATIPSTPPTSVCVSSKTPQPTKTPYANAPATAFQYGAPRLPRQNGGSDLVDTSFYSGILAQQLPIMVYLPPGYSDSTRRYPVLYMLSGFSGDYHEWVNWGFCEQLDMLMRGGYIQPLIAVMPEGGKSWWFNHAIGPDSDGRRWGDYVWKDVVNYADATYRTLPGRESRAIGGLSAGGQAAYALALTHPEVFSIAGAHSPSIRHADGSLAIFGDQAYFDQYDPLWLVRNTDSWKRLTLWLDVAHEDEQWGESIHDFHDLLVSLEIPHDFQDRWHGVHDNDYWSAHGPDYLLWYAAHLAGQPP